MNTTTTHPFVTHVSKLPDVPKMKRASWSSYTRKQADMIVGSFGVKEPLPGKGKALYVNMPQAGYPLVRITKLPSMREGSAMWAMEFFLRD